MIMMMVMMIMMMMMMMITFVIREPFECAPALYGTKVYMYTVLKL